MSLEKLTSIDNSLSNLNSIFGLNFNNTNPKSRKQTKEISTLVNDEFCFNCNEGGNLINCDRCPASFHLLCHDPPLDVDQIPKGEFLCNKCKNHTKIGINLANSKNRTIHFEKYDSDAPLDTLCRMAESFNPKEMTLSTELNLKCELNIPGLNRIKWFANEYKLKSLNNQQKQLTGSNNKKEMCQVCSKFETSKKMIKCDYCESVYHQDCLFSLINEVPTKEKIWMCPLHCEHMLNSKFLKSDKLSYKVKLWNDFHLDFKNLDKIESDFLKKCQTQSTINNSPIDKPIEEIQVPKNVKNSYKYVFKKDKKESCLDEFVIAGEALSLLSSQSNHNVKIKIPSLDRNDLVRPRAMLKYLSDSSYDLFEYPIPLTKSSTTIGNSKKSDICIQNDFIKCKHVSDKHATVYYDYSQDRYELLNYSEFGTSVDGVMLGLDLEDLNDDDQEIENFYEGSLELKHGSVIQLGCFKFLFIVIEYDFKSSFILNKPDEDGTTKKLNDKKKPKIQPKKQQDKNLFKSTIIKKLNQIKEMNLLSESGEDLNLDTIGLCKFINNSNKKNLIC